MSFGGAVSAMITSLKNNKRSRVSAFDKIKTNNAKSSIQLHFKNKATSKELLQIKQKLKLENRKTFRKNLIIFSVMVLIVIYVIGFVKF